MGSSDTTTLSAAEEQRHRQVEQPIGKAGHDALRDGCLFSVSSSAEEGLIVLRRDFSLVHFTSSGKTWTCVESLYSWPVDEVSTTSPMKAR